MKKIAVVIEEGFEDSEFAEPVQALRDNGFDVTVIGPEANKDYQGKRGQVIARTSKSLDDVNAGDFDGLLIPGGHAPEKLRLNKKIVPFIQAFAKANKPIAAICHGPQLLISADLLRGKKATSYESVAIDVKNAGAHFVDAPVVVDGNLITSRKPEDIPQFNKAIILAFSGKSGPEFHDTFAGPVPIQSFPGRD